MIKLLQWNIWYKEDPNNVLNLLKEVDADILCLQELTAGYDMHDKIDVVELIQHELGYEVHAQHMTVGARGSLANAIFSKYPIENTSSVWINEPRGSSGSDDEHRCYIEAVINVNETMITVGTVHMSYTDRFIETDRKLEETSRLLAEIKGKNRYIFTGDLNVTPGSKTIKDIESILQPVGPDYSEPTWTTKPFSYNGFEAKTLDWRLDYAFKSIDLDIRTASIINTDYSDHLPILIEIED